jgi:hypothetical protein
LTAVSSLSVSSSNSSGCWWNSFPSSLSKPRLAASLSSSPVGNQISASKNSLSGESWTSSSPRKTSWSSKYPNTSSMSRTAWPASTTNYRESSSKGTGLSLSSYSPFSTRAKLITSSVSNCCPSTSEPLAASFSWRNTTGSFTRESPASSSSRSRPWKGNNLNLS